MILNKILYLSLNSFICKARGQNSCCIWTLSVLYILPRKDEGYYACFLKKGDKLCLLIGVRSLLFSRRRCKNPSLLLPCDLCMLGLHNFVLCFMKSKAKGLKTFSKCGVRLGDRLVPDFLF